MKSKNFEFLRACRPQLATLGAFAERYALSDPSSALIKLRNYIEQIVEDIYDSKHLPKPYRAGLHDLLNEQVFIEFVPRVVLQKLHALRIRGNKAAHGGRISAALASPLIREAFDVGCWFHVTFDGGKLEDLPKFTEPIGAVDDGKGRLKREKKALLQKLARQEAQLAQLLADLEQERKEREQHTQASLSELEALRQAGEEAANELQFSEAQTRKFLIDSMLVEAGWHVGENGTSTSQVGQEITLYAQPTPSGTGRADYVLWGDDGKPLAVIEAKKTAKSAEAGRTQAQSYASSFEDEYHQRPVIFYTNGLETFIWDDAQSLPPRRLYGFYSKDSLEYLHFQRNHKQQLELIAPRTEIAGRMYQLEAVKRVTECFSDGHRKALLVQATGTGKTRVAISICEVMSRARWAKRILFLCDRRELRKQADNAFKEFLPTEPRTFVSSKTASDRDKRIYLATYPAMMTCFESFDVGFFDLIIADESHRSIYNKYRDLFRYFDAFQVGLTATPVRLLDRNTYGLFGCEDKDPTSNYTLEEAISHTPRYLVPFRVAKVTTRFQREGIKYRQMTDEQKQQLEKQIDDAEFLEHEASDIDRLIFNRDTTRAVLRNVMQNGLRDTSSSLPGKTIIFARNHKHAIHLSDVFNELYPRYGGTFCRVIDNYDPRAEQLIDDFKDPGHELRIAISVDMLDTGIDVPEIVNLVFAKPIKSYVKFWQMIGRGTRLRPNLFGLEKHKSEFLIFDHWGNFEYFDEHYEETEPSPVKSLMQRVFDARVGLARIALDTMDEGAFQESIQLIQADINHVKASRAIEVRDHWRDLQSLGDETTLKSFAAATHAALVDVVAPLMRWCDLRGHEDAHRFDLLIAQLQTALLQGSGAFENLKGQVLSDVEGLSKNLNQVKAKAEIIGRVRSTEFWGDVSVAALGDIRRELRAIMKHKVVVRPPKLEPRMIDVQDGCIEIEAHMPTYEGHELIAYRHRVQRVLEEHFNHHPILVDIRAGRAVSEQDLEALAHQVLKVDPQIDLKHLPVQIRVKGDLHRALRSIVGLDAEAVASAFTEFTHTHRELTSQQLRFLSMLEAHICTNGGLEIDRLYEAPFTTVSAEGIDGGFDDALINELLELIARFDLPEIRGATA